MEIKKDNGKEEEQKADTMESYIFKRLRIIEKQISTITMDDYHSVYPVKEKFHSLCGARDELYMILTGHSNPLANPINTDKIGD